MGINDFVSQFIPEWLDLVNEVVALGAQFFVGGVLVAFIAWSIGYAVYTAFQWLTSWTSAS